jgi:hypothetical protein
MSWFGLSAAKGDSMESLEAIGLPDLLAMRVAIDDGIARQGRSSTAASLAGELMERVVADASERRLASVGTASIDVIADNDERTQVKTRSLPNGCPEALGPRRFRACRHRIDLAFASSTARSAIRTIWPALLGESGTAPRFRRHHPSDPHDRDRGASRI